MSKKQPALTPQRSFVLGVQLLTPEQRDKLWRYIVLTDGGRCYIAPEKQPRLLELLAQLAEEEKLYELDFFARLRRFQELKGKILQEGGPYLALFQ